MSKYHAIRTTIDGINFASRKEALRYCQLKMLRDAGEIHNLELQPKFPIFINGVKIGTYIADFSYFTAKTRVVEDVKGVCTPLYKFKKKAVEAAYPGLTIIEV